MSDEISIQQTLNRYTVAAGRADWDALVATFMADGVWEVPALGISFSGHQAIREGQINASAPFEYIVQLNAPAVITIDGETATAQSVIQETGKFSGRDEGVEVLGCYLDKLARTAHGWKFTQRVFELRAMHSFPLLPQSPL